MTKLELLEGTIHILPKHIASILLRNNDTHEKRNKLTPLARNEWICWLSMPKKETTRKKRIARFIEDIDQGKRRPCCRPGCPHHNHNTKKWFKNSNKKNPN